MKDILYRLFIEDQKPASEIANILNLTVNQVYGKLSKYKIRKNKPKKTEWFNVEFKNLSDEEIYVLGFLWADGYLTCKNRAFGIEIRTDDYEDICSIVKLTGNWGTFIRQPSKKNGVTRKSRTIVTISNVDICNKLKSLDFDKKSYINPNKILDIIPEHKRYLFFRGYFDGDGCFYTTKKVKQFAISSTYDQNWEHMMNLFNNIEIDSYKIVQKTSKLNHKHSIIRISSFKNVKKLSNYIYQNRLDIGLKRKYDKVKDLIDNI
jgi:hypothetical protein